MFGQIPDFTNGFDFVRRLWGSGGGMPGSLMPGLQAMTPPMDLDDLDKRIQDLKAVESWLQLNTNLLRTTIQGLEVQRATLVALQTFGNALSPEAMQSAMENVARAANAPSAAPHERAGADTGSGPAPQPQAQEPPAAEGTQGEQAASGEAESAVPPNAGLWWDLLQQQFSQIASSAAAASIAPFGMGGFGGVGPSAPGQAPDAKPENGAPRTAATAKPAAKSAAKPAAKKAAAKKAPAKKAVKAKPPARDAGNGKSNGNHGGGANGANGANGKDAS